MKKQTGFGLGAFGAILMAAGVGILGLTHPATGAIITSQDAITHDGRTVVMDFVTIGDVGNAARPAPGLGAVDYEYRIGMYEVTEAQWNAYTGVGGGGNLPKVHVSWHDAAKFTNWLTTGNTELGVYAFTYDGATITDVTIDRSYHNADGLAYFLPNDNEWYKAAYYDPGLNNGGGGYWQYPTRSDDVPIAETPAGGSNSANWAKAMGGSWGARTDVGAYLDSFSAYGAYDMAGNVWEWVETGISGGNRKLMGGDHINENELLMRAAYGGTSKMPTATASSDGFRVASSFIPEPTTGMLLFLGGLLISRRGRR